MTKYQVEDLSLVGSEGTRCHHRCVEALCFDAIVPTKKAVNF